jgi:holo-[acyl-carrier protein] synthase
MIVGVGIDLMETARMERAIERHGSRLERRLFTAGERADCAGRADRFQGLAARFAAKEAVLKALGTGLVSGMAWTQIEVVRAASGRPTLRFAGAVAERARSSGVATAHLSLTHQPGTAAAVVVLESGRSA